MGFLHLLISGKDYIPCGAAQLCFAKKIIFLLNSFSSFVFLLLVIINFAITAELSPLPCWFTERSREGRQGTREMVEFSAADLLFPLTTVQRILYAGFFTLLYHLQQPALPNPSLYQSMIPLTLCFFSLHSAFCCFQHFLVSLLTTSFERSRAASCQICSEADIWMAFLQARNRIDIHV